MSWKCVIFLALLQDFQDKRLKDKLEPELARKRIEKNKEWRGRKNGGEEEEEQEEEVEEGEGPGCGSSMSGGRKCVEWLVRSHLQCVRCQG